jgi:hypothetical protein
MAAARTARALAPTSACGGNYERHRPEDTVLYQTLQAHWRVFLAEIGGGAEVELPRFVLEEVEAFLKCGILAHGSCASSATGARRIGWWPFRASARLLQLVPGPTHVRLRGPTFAIT